MQGGSLWGFIHGDGSYRPEEDVRGNIAVAKDVGCHGVLVRKGIIHRDLKSQNCSWHLACGPRIGSGIMSPSGPKWRTLASLRLRTHADVTAGATQKLLADKHQRTWPPNFSSYPTREWTKVRCVFIRRDVVECFTGGYPGLMANHLQVIFAVAVEAVDFRCRMHLRAAA